MSRQKSPAKRLAELVRQASTYAEVEVAKEQYPNLSFEAAKHLTQKDLERINALKPPLIKLRDALGKVANEEEFWAIADAWNDIPAHRETLEDAIAIAKIPFGERCKLRRWWENGWRDRAPEPVDNLQKVA